MKKASAQLEEGSLRAGQTERYLGENHGVIDLGGHALLYAGDALAEALIIVL